MKKLVLAPLVLVGCLYAEDCKEFERKADKWFDDATGSIFEINQRRGYGKVSYYLGKAIICQNVNIQLNQIKIFDEIKKIKGK